MAVGDASERPDPPSTRAPRGAFGVTRRSDALVSHDIFGGDGRDLIKAVDRDDDDVDCGAGFDRVRANPGDDVEGDCERVVRDGPRVGDDDDGDDD